MVYGFAKQAGGTVEIDSFEGRGTNVRIYVPRSRELPPPDIALPQTETQRSKGGETVLLAEDNPSVRVLIADLLAELGYDAIISEDGQRAADMLSSGRRIDLLISDVGLPGLNGRQVAEIGRQKWPLLKILFITGYAEAARLRSGFLPEGADMIAKPFEMDALAGKIRELLNSGARENAIAPD
jgi:CheY-like chemotaxis protein